MVRRSTAPSTARQAGLTVLVGMIASRPARSGERSGAIAELVHATGQRVIAEAFDTVFARGTTGTNRRNVTNPLAFELVFQGNWV